MSCPDNLMFSFNSVHLKNDFLNPGCLKTVESVSEGWAGSKKFNWSITIIEVKDNAKRLKTSGCYFKQLYSIILIL